MAYERTPNHGRDERKFAKGRPAEQKPIDTTTSTWHGRDESKVAPNNAREQKPVDTSPVKTAGIATPPAPSPAPDTRALSAHYPRTTPDTRADGTQKGLGFFGAMKRPDGNVSTELSIGVKLNGKETQIPTIVPTLNKGELDYLLTTPVEKLFTQNPDMFRSIERKAVEHAKQRIDLGKSPFAEIGEQRPVKASPIYTPKVEMVPKLEPKTEVIIQQPIPVSGQDDDRPSIPARGVSPDRRTDARIDEAEEDLDNQSAGGDQTLRRESRRKSFGSVIPSGGGDYSDLALGFSCDADVVTVNSGYLFHGTRTAIAITGDDVTIAADATYIYVTYTFNSGVATIESTTSFPAHTEEVLNWILYKVTLTTGTASVEEGDIYHLGNITIPGSFA